MKKHLSLLFAAAVTLVLGAGCDKGDNPTLHDTYYYFEGAKIPLTAMKTKCYMIFKTADKQAVIDALTARGATFDTTRIYPYRYGLSDKDVPELIDCSDWIVETGKPISYGMIPKPVYLAPYYLTSDSYEMGLSNLLEVRPEGSDGLEKLQSLADRYHFFILGKDSQDQSIYRVACTQQTKGNALEIANLIYEKYGFYAAPYSLAIIVSIS